MKTKNKVTMEKLTNNEFLLVADVVFESYMAGSKIPNAVKVEMETKKLDKDYGVEASSLNKKLEAFNEEHLTELCNSIYAFWFDSLRGKIIYHIIEYNPSQLSYLLKQTDEELILNLEESIIFGVQEKINETHYELIKIFEESVKAKLKQEPEKLCLKFEEMVKPTNV